MKDVSQLITEGKFYFKSQKYKRAEEVLRQATAIKKDFADVQNILGLISPSRWLSNLLILKSDL